MRRYISFTLVILWMLLIFYFSGRNADVSSAQSEGVLQVLRSIFPILNSLDQLDVIFILRKAAHFFMYFLLAILVYRCQKPEKNSLEKTLLTVALVFMYAALDEYHQSFVLGRNSSFQDVLIDLFGGVTGIFMLNII